MKKLEDELGTVENEIDSDLLMVDTKIKKEVTPPQVSPYHNGGNPLVSQYTHVTKGSKASQPKTSPVQGVYGRDEGYTLRHRTEGAPLPDVTQHGQRVSKQTPMLVQQVVQSPVYVNFAPGNIQQLSDGRQPLVQLEGVTHLNQLNKTHQTSQPLLIQNNTKGVTPLILKSTDASFSPVILQSNIINPETQTLMYTSAPVQGMIHMN